MVEEYARGVSTVSEICNRFGISKPTLYRTLERLGLPQASKVKAPERGNATGARSSSPEDEATQQSRDEDTSGDARDASRRPDAVGNGNQVCEDYE